jgi:hypothetical protein
MVNIVNLVRSDVKYSKVVEGQRCTVLNEFVFEFEFGFAIVNLYLNNKHCQYVDSTGEKSKIVLTWMCSSREIKRFAWLYCNFS